MLRNTIKYSKICTTALLAVVLLLCSFATSIAVTDKNPSPVKDNEYILIVHHTKGGLANKLRINKNYYKATAHEKDGYKFTHWVINGKYIFQKGSLKSKTIKLTLRSDCEATPYFKAISKNKNNKPIRIDESPISPKTGDISDVLSGNNIVLFALIIAFAIVSIAIIGIACGSFYAFVFNNRRKKQIDE